jgi:uncharacterized damage-inducible protein DinB
MKNTHTLHLLIDLQTKQLNNLLEKVTDEISNQEKNNLNSIKWLVGHLVNTRLMILSTLTKTPSDPEFAKLFGRGSSGKIDSTFPTIDELKEKWNETSEKITTEFNTKSDEDFNEKSPIPFPVGDDTLIGFISYLVYHEAFHIGQLSIVKRIL